MAESVPEQSQIPNGNPQVDEECINQRVDEVSHWVDSLEHKVKDVEEFYSSNASGASISGSVDKGRHVAAKRTQDLMRKFGTIYRQITQHNFAGPFIDPVDVEGLGLHDYYKIIKKPMDFSTIKNKMEAKDGTGYRHVRQIYDDMRLVFDNAMKYNEEKSEIYYMAKTLLEKLEEKWLHFLPKVQEENEEEKQAATEALLAKEAFYTKTTRVLRNEICKADEELDKLKNIVMERCRKVTKKEKLDLGAALTELSNDDIRKAVDIVTQSGDPSFQPEEGKMEIEIDLMDEPTLWRLKFFVREALLNSMKKKKEEMAKAGDLNGTQNKVVSTNKRNVTSQAEERKTKRRRM